MSTLRIRYAPYSSPWKSSMRIERESNKKRVLVYLSNPKELLSYSDFEYGALEDLTFQSDRPGLREASSNSFPPLKVPLARFLASQRSPDSASNSLKVAA